jgi:hypothetical protein
VVAQPLRLAETLFYSGSCVAPLRLGGLRGKKSTPSVWLGGTGEHSWFGKQDWCGSGFGRTDDIEAGEGNGMLGVVVSYSFTTGCFPSQRACVMIDFRCLV